MMVGNPVIMVGNPAIMVFPFVSPLQTAIYLNSKRNTSEKIVMANWLENVVAKSTQNAEWRLIGSIGQWGDINAKDFNKQLATLEARHSSIDMVLHSAGGSINEGLQMYNRLLKSKSNINTDIEGIAASMASVVAMAGKRRRIAKYGRMMLHQGRNTVSGSGNHLIKKGEELNALNQQLAEIYAEAIKHKHPDRDADWVLANWLVEGVDKYFSAEEAREAGLVHEIYDPGLKGAPATASFDEMVAFYDNSLTNEEPEAQDEPTAEPKSITNRMKKEQLILMLAKQGITFEDTVTADGSEDAFMDALAGKIKQMKSEAAKASALQAKIEELEGSAFQEELTAAQADGRITAKQVPHYEKLADKFGNDEAIAALKEIEVADVDITLKRREKKPVDSTLSKERDAWNYQAWEEKDPDGLIALADDDPDKYKSILDAYDPEAKSNAK